MTIHVFVLACLLASYSQAVAPHGIVGDELPPQLPVVDVHVPEPSASALERGWVANENSDKQQLLEEINSRMGSKRSLLINNMRSLRSRIEQMSHLVEPLAKAESFSAHE